MSELLGAREVPLGGPRAMTVRRSLPSRTVRTVGAWCFVDQYGPETDQHAMVVPPHPHTGLQTVTWLLSGLALHQDSVGGQAQIRPGQLNLMTSGAGISHGERSLAQGSDPLHGVQLWVALPDAERHQAPHFEHHADLPVQVSDGMRTTVLVGTYGGATSPAATYSPLVGVEWQVAPGRHRAALETGFEHAVLLASGAATVAGADPAVGDLVHLPAGAAHVDLQVREPSTLLLLGGEPFAEQLVMWWNFVGRDHDEVVQARADWQARDDRFGTVEGWDAESWLRAPEMPGVRLRPRPARAGSAVTGPPSGRPPAPPSAG